MTESDQQSGVADDRSDRSDAASAGRVVVSYPAALSEAGRRQLEKRSFRSYLHKTRDEAREGDVWEEFVGVGCGTTRDVSLRVERVDGGAEITDETAIGYASRDDGELEDG
ncbi:hypothetical protein Htur_0746 [Haloterrigena turkmenica DSM 5511]|uniref:DUF7968 domain-containing protein n=1 Tax=Haloterrigena turkmenica (strain ATCC 51198 / DSM 5511 / JCM 9101 / NCIMB 13204 / VKM B-1734 / 4k) TaxID=543526 RepID=D2RX31_HALTV|nr:hypothetical protein [Haloterrigena turkmenica]ADB59643.1 hypothetical protein Htur_0746 [Haloterrigena turkmenica DSM 5511]